MSECIRGPALRADGEVYWLHSPAQHSDVRNAMQQAGVPAGVAWGADQGFVTTESRYVTREEAWHIAQSAGQISRPEKARSPGELFTECMAS